MRTAVLLAVLVAVFAFCFAPKDSDAGVAAAHFKEWLAEFVQNLRHDVIDLFELLRVAGDLVNRANKFAREGHEEYVKASKSQKKFNWFWTEATHQDTCKRVYFYSTINNLTGLHGLKGVAEFLFILLAKTACMYFKLIQWFVMLRIVLCSCASCDRWGEDLAAHARDAVRAPVTLPAPAVVPLAVVVPAPAVVPAPTRWTQFLGFCRRISCVFVFHFACFVVLWM
jgi:hypothetical protein